MSLQEQRIQWYIPSNFAEAIVGVGVTAIQIFMWIYMAVLYVYEPSQTRKIRLPYLVASLTILLLSGAAYVELVVNAYHVLLEIVPGPENLQATLEVITMNYERYAVLGGLLGDIALRVAATVLLYRTYLVWFDFCWVVVLPACLLLVNCGIALRTYIPLNYDNSKLDAADVLTLVALNVILTCLISFRLIRAYRQFSAALPYTEHKSYLGVVGALFESAAPATVCGIGYAITRLDNDAEQTLIGFQAATIFQVLFQTSSILSPQIIIFRVTTGMSWVNRADTSAILSRPIEFNGNARDRTDDESGIEADEC